MRRLLFAVAGLLAACADEQPDLLLEALVMADGGALEGEPGAQRLRLAVGTVGVFGLRAIPPSEPEERRWLGVGEAHVCDSYALELRPVAGPSGDGGVGVAEREHSLAGTPLRRHDLQRFALFAVRPGESCVELPSSEGRVRVRVLVEAR